ncbi:hypothetical protein HGRIS_007779 [Hohenbuehelia grisea]|uniref:NUDE domain-containing protein n=1 Tax=Hohenbuehelia grisea TaxID=104357 RepID=A0ABR3J5X5_9AGAR
MTAILQATDHFRRDRMMSLDDNQINYSPTSASTDWRAKYNEVADMLAETRAELDEFHVASKELEAELESELQRTEKAHEDLKIKVAKAETERDDWKSKFMTLQTTFNTTTTSLQRELDKLRQEHQNTKIQLRELEMGNDDLERTERAVSSSLADAEAKYSKALEEKILLEHELLDKANMEEASQRLKDELRDANVEISILKDQLAAAQAQAQPTPSPPILTPSIDSSSSATVFPTYKDISDDNLLATRPPPDLQLTELGTSSESDSAPNTATPRATQRAGQSALLQRAGFPTNKPTFSPGSSNLSRSSTLPSFIGSPSSSPRTPTMRPASNRNPSVASTSSSVSAAPSVTARSKGVQMASAMRARVRNLEQKIHTRVPRLRMGSITGRSNNSATADQSRSSKPSFDEVGLQLPAVRKSAESRQPYDSDSDKGKSKDSSGWVLIMEDSPSPQKDRTRERRRLSSPSPAAALRAVASTSIPSPTFSNSRGSPLAQSTMNITGVRRPQSRLSGNSLSTATTTSSIPTPTSRPATPTFLPIPTSGLYAHSSTAGMSGLKRSTGPAPGGPYSQAKRSSLGASTAIPSPRPGSSTPSSTGSRDDTVNGKALPKLPSLHSNITVRQSAKAQLSGSSANLLGKSRIGRLSGSGRRSVGDADGVGMPDSKKDLRPRSGSSAALYGK